MSNNVCYNLGGYILPAPASLKNSPSLVLTCTCRMDQFSQIVSWKEHIIKEHPVEGLKVKAYFCGEQDHKSTMSLTLPRFIQHMNKSHPATRIDQSVKLWQWKEQAWQACGQNESESEIDLLKEAANTPRLKLRRIDQTPSTDTKVSVKKMTGNSDLNCACKLTPYKVIDSWIGHIANKHASEGMTLNGYICQSHGNKIFLQRHNFYSHITELHPGELTDHFRAVVTFTNGKWEKAPENAKLSDNEFLKKAASIHSSSISK